MYSMYVCIELGKQRAETTWNLFDNSFPVFLSGDLQATRALMIVGIIISIAGLGVACIGMKCTTCGADDKVRKSRTAMTGGIILLVGGNCMCERKKKVVSVRLYTSSSNISVWHF